MSDLNTAYIKGTYNCEVAVFFEIHIQEALPVMAEYLQNRNTPDADISNKGIMACFLEQLTLDIGYRKLKNPNWSIFDIIDDLKEKYPPLDGTSGIDVYRIIRFKLKLWDKQLKLKALKSR